MKVTSIKAKSSEDASSKSETWLELTKQGELLQFSGALQELGFYSTIKNLTLQVIADHSSTNIAEKIKSEGFEKLHLHLDGAQIEKINIALSQTVKPHVSRLVKNFVEKFLGYSHNIFIDSLPVVRFFVPHDVFVKNAAQFSKRPGFLKIQGPHHDTWFDHATGGLNMWMAIGRVQKGNGLLIFPDHWNHYIPHDGRRQMPRSQKLGPPINFDLAQGDLLFFHGEHLHASEINITSETRYVITTRFVLKRPYFKETQQWHPWYTSSLVGTKLEKVATLHSYFSLGFLRYFFWAMGHKFRKLFKLAEKQTKTITPPRPEAAKFENTETADINNFQEGEIKPISNAACALRKDNKLYAFSRYCPHEGADLALGQYEKGSLYCPWHHLKLDPQTGQHPCETLKPLKLFQLK